MYLSYRTCVCFYVYEVAMQTNSWSLVARNHNLNTDHKQRLCNFRKCTAVLKEGIWTSLFSACRSTLPYTMHCTDCSRLEACVVSNNLVYRGFSCDVRRSRDFLVYSILEVKPPVTGSFSAHHPCWYVCLTAWITVCCFVCQCSSTSRMTCQQGSYRCSSIGKLDDDLCWHVYPTA